jgi:hypothetical protein
MARKRLRTRKFPNTTVTTRNMPPSQPRARQQSYAMLFHDSKVRTWGYGVARGVEWRGQEGTQHTLQGGGAKVARPHHNITLGVGVGRHTMSALTPETR